MSFEAQSLFIRILTLVDDFGRFDARVPILHGQCFALRDDIKPQRTAAMRGELQAAKLIEVYTVDGRDYLQVTQWQERARSERSKFPDPSQVVDISTSAADGSGTQDSAASIDHRSSPEVIDHRPPPLRENAQAAEVTADSFMSEWNKLPKPFTKIRSMSENRKTALRARLKDEFWRTNWIEAMSQLPALPFCCGESESGWIADVEFFLRPGSVAKIMEGKYAEREEVETREVWEVIEPIDYMAKLKEMRANADAEAEVMRDAQ